MKTKLFFLIISVIFFETKIIGANLFISDKSKNELVKEKRGKTEVQNLDKIYSSKKLGSFVEGGKTYFRLFAPNAEDVFLVTFKNPENSQGKEYEMVSDYDGVWEIILDGEQYGLFYGFKVENKSQINKGTICVDPYAKAVATLNTYMNPRRAIVVKEEDYNWENDTWIQRDWRDLIIYEMHIRDMTEHPSSGSSKPGTYSGLVEKGITGGIDYIKNLGVNTVELLPVQEFANIEIPFKKPMAGSENTWNPYERNYWGYMTAAYFAPDEYYSYTDSNPTMNEWTGKTTERITEFKDMVKTFHKEGIGVIMDVVYNHLSEYEIGNLKEIDKDYYFRLDENGNFISQSYCGNDLRTERPMLRRLIVESILYWMKEYHVDGFRFDLGKLLDWETIEEIIYEARKINPSAVFVCEPWGGGYDPMGFSNRGWGSWNDQIRNGIKGENPTNGLGWIFGKWYGNNNRGRIKSYVNGTLTRDKFGLFSKKEHSVNYLESHDGYTLGDFIRIGSKEVDPLDVIEDLDNAVKLTPLQMKLNKLAALFLFTSQGITMINSGQEFARSKVIPVNIIVPDENKGRIDHNTYNKDNETNYINYEHAKINKELVDYYKGLISLRKNFAAFRRANYNDVEFYDDSDNQFTLAYAIKYNNDEFIVLFNADNRKEHKFVLPEGEFDILVNDKNAGINSLGNTKLEVLLKPVTGMVLKKK